MYSDYSLLLTELSVSKWNIFDVGLAYSLIEQPDTIPPYSQLLIQYNVINQSNVSVMQFYANSNYYYYYYYRQLV